MKHGGDLGEAAERFGHDGEPWLDLSTGINPHTYPLPAALRSGDWTRLPSDRDLARLTDAARRAFRVPPEAGLVAAPGTQALIQWLPRLAPAGGVAIVGPTYAEHEAAWRLAGRDVAPGTPLPLAGRGRGWGSGRIERGGASCPTPTPAAPAARRDPPRKGEGWRRHGHGDPPGDVPNVVVVNPNNPDGRILSRADLAAAAEACRDAGGWLVVDESFADLAPDASVVDLCSDHPVVVLRSFGKFYGLAGLRLGFAVAPREVAERIGVALGPWAVSAPAIEAGALALADEGWAEAMRLRLAGESRRLDAVLTGAGLAVVGGTSLFRLARVEGAGRLHGRLAERHIWVRRFAWSDDLLRFGLPPDAAGLERLARALAEVR